MTSDTALYDWLSTGAKVELSQDEVAARRASEFARRFHAAMNPETDLGATEELHEQAVASRVFAVHAELNQLGEGVYSEVWSMLSAPVRRALKTYIATSRAGELGT
jgi:hypothetical protein